MYKFLKLFGKDKEKSKRSLTLCFKEKITSAKKVWRKFDRTYKVNKSL